jgi:hypothetical protein
MHDFHALEQGPVWRPDSYGHGISGRWPDLAGELLRLQAADENADQVCAV